MQIKFPHLYSNLVTLAIAYTNLGGNEAEGNLNCEALTMT